jgi:chorismate dehydratase
MHLKLGHINYLNCAPLFHYLRRCGFQGSIINGVPSQLNRMLCTGEVDVSPSSSFAYGEHFEEYYLLPGHSISAFRQVQSVLFFSPKPLEQLRNQRIYITGESATSVNLLRVILQEYCGWSAVEFEVPSQPMEQLLQAGEPALLIGDSALKASLNTNCQRYIQYDLAHLWNHYTKLPFVFALWIIRRDIFTLFEGEIKLLQRQLEQSRELSFNDLLALAEATPLDWIDNDQLVNYWQSMSYHLDEPHIAGLNYFFQLCVKYGCLPKLPQLNFAPFAQG